MAKTLEIKDFTEESRIDRDLVSLDSLLKQFQYTEALAFDQQFEGVPLGNTLPGITGAGNANQGLEYGASGRTTFWQSKNYVTTISGWRIDSTGTVEFASGTFRGTLNLITGELSTPYGGIGRGQNFLLSSNPVGAGANWTRNNVTAGASVAAPDGTTSAITLTSTVADGNVQQGYNTGSALTNRTFTFSVWLRADSATTSRLLILSSNTTPGSQTYSVGTNWARHVLTATFGADVATTVTARIVLVDGGTGTIYAWGGQLEESSSVGVYTYTVDTRVTTTIRGFIGTFISVANQIQSVDWSDGTVGWVIDASGTPNAQFNAFTGGVAFNSSPISLVDAGISVYRTNAPVGYSFSVNYDTKTVLVGGDTLGTGATDGFLYIPVISGAPTGTPTSSSGRAPIVVDITNHRFYIYESSAWRYAALT